MRLVARAPGKVNLCLFLGPSRGDGRHELVTLFESVSLADELSAEVRPQAPDIVRCGEVIEPNLVSMAIERLRARGWTGPSVEVEITKRVPLAGGMGGGSADAAAILRIAHDLEPVSEETLLEVAADLGADVPSQLVPGLTLGTGAGERVRAYPPIEAHALLILPTPPGLSTREVYAEADRLGLRRDDDELELKRGELEAALSAGGRLPVALVTNDLQRAAISLRPEISETLEAVRSNGADAALVSGSGPTVFGLFWGDRHVERAQGAAAALRDRFPEATTAMPVDAAFGHPTRAA